MSKKEKKSGIYIRATGQYVEKTLSHKLPREYDVEVMLTDNPEAQVPPERRLHYLMFRKLLPHYFETNIDKYPGYTHVRTCKTHGVEIVGERKGPVNADKPIEKMTRNELVQYCFEKDLNTDPKKYTTVADARQAVLDELENRRIAEQEELRREAAELLSKKAEESDLEEFLQFNKVS